jgi:hypothetical protein
MQFGSHWMLSEKEADTLARRFDKFIDTIPKTAKAKWIKKLEKYFPGILFVGALGSVTYPRVMLTVMMYEQQRQANSTVDSHSGAVS